jgi:DNA-directed RNA polymerase subunit RPC12/RpoP
MATAFRDDWHTESTRSKWVVDEKRFGDSDIRCEICGYYLGTDTYEYGVNNYCPYCGSKKLNPNGKYQDLKDCLTNDKEEETK